MLRMFFIAFVTLSCVGKCYEFSWRIMNAFCYLSRLMELIEWKGKNVTCLCMRSR